MSEPSPEPRTRRAFLLLLISHVGTKIGDGLLNPKTTLTWVMSALSAPAFLIGLLVPIRESGSMLPQIMLSGLLQRVPRKKWAWIGGAFLQALCVFGMAAAARWMSAASAGWTIIGCLTLFSLARSICSITGKDIIGRTIPKRRRGRLNGWQTSASGLVVLAIGLTLSRWSTERPELLTLSLLLFAAAGLWFIGGAVMVLLDEPRDGYAKEDVLDLRDRLGLLVHDRPFRCFVITRTFMMGSALIAPYYVVIAQHNTEGALHALGGLIVASGLAQWLSAGFWGRFADRSSRLVMVWASVLAGGLGLVVGWTEALGGTGLPATWWYAGIYFISVVAHSGVRVGRKTYVVDLGGNDRRAHYVAVSNTLMGLLLFVVGGVGTALGAWSSLAAIVFYSAACLVGAWTGFSLEEVTRET